MDLFAAVADPTRRHIIELLSVNEQMSASEIFEHFDVSPQAISQHLKVLRESELVTVERRAQMRIYRLNDERLDEMEKWIRNIRQRWSRRLDALGDVLKANRTPLN
jgi:Predicted transcriptional regulators